MLDKHSRPRGQMIRARLMGGAAGVALAALGLSGAAHADSAGGYTIAPQPLEAALNELGVESHHQVLFRSDLAASKTTKGVANAPDVETALAGVLEGTGLGYQRSGDTFLIVAGESEGNVVQELVVTAQKKEEAIQTVPIAISAFTQKNLEEQHIEGGFDLLKAIPNVTFSKNNFTSYNFSIRGIGTKAISATTDPGVAVSFNNTSLIQNRLFEQEYFDIERVEVLRGPQGTLYGRNATAGVINVISAKPTDVFEGSLKAEVGNYQSRRASGFINIPIFGEKLAVRLAGSYTQRDGYDYNSVTKHQINGRDLWSGRLTIGFKPFEKLHGNFIWEHFNEDDNRSRTGKQLCHRDDGLQKIGDTPTTEQLPEDIGAHYSDVMRPVLFSQGCKPGSLYDASAFGTPNGLALPFVYGMLAVRENIFIGTINGEPQVLVDLKDPYGGMMQSPDLRTIASFNDPKYRAKNDTFELNWDFDLTPSLTFSSLTAYSKDSVYSFQDFNRFNTQPIFVDTSKLDGETYYKALAPGGVYCDPQLGCSNTLAGFDISRSDAKQFSQEIRLQSSFSGPLNFVVGANYTRFQALVDYYVFYNLITGYAQINPFGGPSITDCYGSGFNGSGPPVPRSDIHSSCPYIDPNPIDSIDGDGHNYFRSKNPYKLKSAAAFGEIYWQATPSMKVTAGLRYTDDHKTFIPVPSQILLAPFLLNGGFISKGYPEFPAIRQHWGEVTGRLGVDWKPALSFTDQTMLYAFYSRGYKGGGANPPTPGFGTKDTLVQFGALTQDEANFYDSIGFLYPHTLQGVDYGPTFKPEFVNAFEFGTKNTLLGGAMTLNTSVFYYDYKDYQVSQIRDRTAVNENFDAKIWGAELETLYAPTKNTRINFNFGYLDTRIADGESSIDIMNRTASNPNYIVVKPWVQLPSNCVVPEPVAEEWLKNNARIRQYFDLCGGAGGLIHLIGIPQWDPTLMKNYDVRDYPELNGGGGIKTQLGGNELPNSPHWTMNLGVQQGWDFLEGWRATLRGDAYWQSQSWARVYNLDTYDKLHGWYNVNLSLWVEKPEIGLKIEIYAKNLLDKTPITDSFLNSDDTALTTNVFVLDPRLIGFSITKTF